MSYGLKSSGAQRFCRAQQHIQSLAKICRAELSLIEEVQPTRDDRRDHYDADGNEIGWTCTPTPPAGPGWVIKDDSSDRKTKWCRWIVVPGKMQ
jgi:hypothetical protein